MPTPRARGLIEQLVSGAAVLVEGEGQYALIRKQAPFQPLLVAPSVVAPLLQKNLIAIAVDDDLIGAEVLAPTAEGIRERKRDED